MVMEQYAVERVRPRRTYSTTRRVNVGDRRWYITLGLSEDASVIETFVNGANSPVLQEGQEFIGKMTSLLFRYGVSSERIIKALSGIKSDPTWNDGEIVMSVPDALALTLSALEEKSAKERLNPFGIEPQLQTTPFGASHEMQPRPQILLSKTFSFSIDDISYHVVVTLKDGKPFEVWMFADEAGSEHRAFYEAFGRLTSIALRLLIPIDEICAEMVGVKSVPTINYDPNGESVIYASATDAVGRLILDLAELGDTAPPLTVQEDNPKEGHPVAPMREGVTERVVTGRGKAYVTLNYDNEGRPVEVIGSIGKAGDEEAALLEWSCRLASHTLRNGATRQEIIEMGESITTSPAWNIQDDGSRSVLVKSIPHAVSLVVNKHWQGPSVPEISSPIPLLGFVH